MRRFAVLAAFAAMVFVAAVSPLAQRGPTAPVWPGYKGEGRHAAAQRLAHRARKGVTSPSAICR